MSSSETTPSIAILKRLWGLLFGLLNSDFTSLVIDGIHLLRAIAQERKVGLYEVLDFDHTLELHDASGKKATYHKRETVQLLQDYVAAYVDEAWGKGQIFAGYRCSPGVPVDRYRCGHATYTLISLQEIKRKGDILQISINRTVRDGFNVDTGWSETTVRHRIHDFRISVIFPKKRLPEWVKLIEVNRNRTTSLDLSHTQVLPDGRRQVSWETKNPKLFETYTLKWLW